MKICKLASYINHLRGPTQNFGQKLTDFFFAEKASSGMWEICPKILGGYAY